MEIKDLTLEELKIIHAMFSNSSFRIADAVRLIPIHDKIAKTIQKLEPKKEAK